MGYIYDDTANCFIRAHDKKLNLPHIMWHITYQCELNCKFCFASYGQGQFDTDLLEDYIGKFKKLGVQKIDISGGEPLLYQWIEEICGALFDNNIFMTLTTRGIGLQDNLEWVVNNREKFVRIILSLDVPNDVLQQEITGNGQSFHNTKHFASLLTQIGYRRTRINTVVTKYLLEESVLEQMINMVFEMGVAEWCLIEPHPANKKNTFEEVAVTRKEFESVVTKICERNQEKKRCEILIRNIENYAGYWVLYPDGILAKHTESEKDTMEMDFAKISAQEIMEQVEKSDIWIPEEKKNVIQVQKC